MATVQACKEAREEEFYLDVVEELLARGEKEKKNCAAAVQCGVLLRVMVKLEIVDGRKATIAMLGSCKERMGRKKTRTAFIYGRSYVEKLAGETQKSNSG